MSEPVLDVGKVLLGAFAGPASLPDRRLLQLTIRDGSDTAQLTAEEASRIASAIHEWLRSLETKGE